MKNVGFVETNVNLIVDGFVVIEVIVDFEVVEQVPIIANLEVVEVVFINCLYEVVVKGGKQIPFKEKDT